MEKLAETEFFNFLKNSSLTVTNEELEKAYETFMKEIQTLNQSDKDCMTVFRSLSLSRIEFQVLQTQILYEQGEKCV